MLNIEMTVKVGGVESKVIAGPSTQVAFEREHDTGIMAIATEQKITHIYWLAWHASKPGVDFDTWLDTVEAIEVEIEDVGPTQPARPAA